MEGSPPLSSRNVTKSVLKGGSYENDTCPKTHGCCIGLRAYLNLHEPVRTVARLCSGRAPCAGRAPAVLVALRRCAARQPPRPQEWRGTTPPEPRGYLLLPLVQRFGPRRAPRRSDCRDRQGGRLVGDSELFRLAAAVPVPGDAAGPDARR